VRIAIASVDPVLTGTGSGGGSGSPGGGCGTIDVDAPVRSFWTFEWCNGRLPHTVRMQPLMRTSAVADTAATFFASTVKTALPAPCAGIPSNEQVAYQALGHAPRVR
jgi:hypothetical protein